MKKEKLDAFTDAVIAIIITLMVLEIKLPKVNAASILEVLRSIGIYALSFVVIGITWLNYSTAFKYIEKLTTKIIWLNLLFLFLLSLVPLPTQALGENFFEKESHMFYGIILSSVSTVFSLLQLEAFKGMTHLAQKDINTLNRKNWIGTGLYVLSIPLCLVSIYLSTFIFVLLPVMYFIPSGKNF